MRRKKIASALRATEHVVDRRQNVRYDLVVPVTFVWKNQNGKRHRAEGYTRDLSKEGAFVVANTCPPLGSYVQIKLFLPPLKRGTNPVQMSSTARVTRVDCGERYGQRAEPSSGFAIATQHFKLFNKAYQGTRATMQEAGTHREGTSNAD